MATIAPTIFINIQSFSSQHPNILLIGYRPMRPTPPAPLRLAIISHGNCYDIDSETFSMACSHAHAWPKGAAQ